MKYAVGPRWPGIISVIASALIISLTSPAQAGFWALEKQFGNRDNVTHDEIVEFIYRYTTSPSDDKATDPSAIPSGRKQLYESLFEPPAVKIPFRQVQETGAWQDGPTKKVLRSGTMYYSEGDLFVINETSGAQTKSDSRNFATIDEKLYTWKTGAAEGKILKRFTGDTVELVDYLIDIGLIKASFFHQYQESPEKFTVTEVDGVIELKPNESTSGLFGGIRLTTNPLWISSIVMYECSTDICDKLDLSQERIVLETDEPIPLDEIPADVRALPPGVTFTPSKATANNFMTYL